MTNFTPTHDEITARAYEIYVREGCQPGRDVENWLQAEHELKIAAAGRVSAPEQKAAQPASPSLAGASPLTTPTTRATPPPKGPAAEKAAPSMAGASPLAAPAESKKSSGSGKSASAAKPAAASVAPAASPAPAASTAKPAQKNPAGGNQPRKR